MGNMVRIRLKGFDTIKVRAKKAIDAAISSNETMDAIGKELVKMHQVSIRAQENPYAKASQWGTTRFPPLSKAWIKYRKKLAEVNQTGLGYGPRKSNITFTGQLVNAIRYKSNTSRKEVVIDLDDSKRQQYMGLRGKPIGDPGLTNQQLAKYMDKNGLTFIGLTAQMKTRAIQMVERSLRRMLRTFR
jgi:hypothetical protein